jgi:DNA-binding LytR/AlgR family response regulator
LVNAAKIEEIIPWFNNTYQLVLQDCSERDIPVARHFVREFNRRMHL